MNKPYTTRTWAEIDLDSIAYNLRAIRAQTKKHAKIMCVVKADAYGHGFFEIAKTLQENGADAFAVATFEEALLLRKHGFKELILVLGRVDEAYAEEMVKNDISVAVFDMSLAKKLSDSAMKLEKKAKIHIKLDTGMSRIGFDISDESADKIAEVCALPSIEPEGIFSHFACADEENKKPSQEQFSAFSDMLKKLEDRGIIFTYRHICNSAGIIEFPEYHLDMVRPGIILYGCYPSDEVDKNVLPLKPAMTVKARIVRIDTKSAGTSVSYGGTYKTTKPTKIATVSIGYADGYLRALSNKAYMSIRGVKVPVVGRICMDLCMIDVSDVNTISVGDEVIVFGNGGENDETATSLAAMADTISYELLCAVGNRTPRVYLKNDQVVDVLTYL